MRWSLVLGVARAEARSIRRLARFWIFGAVAAILGMVSYIYYAVIHGLFSHYSASIGPVSPKYFFAALGLWPLILFLVGVVFLAFDVRARDERERMAEVLDVRPTTNLELLTGRFLGTLLPGWVPILAIALLLQAFGWLAETLAWPVGEVMEPYSIFGFVFLSALPAFAFTLAFVFFVSVALGNRLVSALVGLGVLGVAVFLFYRVPFYLGETTGLAPTSVSELLPSLMEGQGLLYRFALLVAAGGFLIWAAAIHPRPDVGSRPRRLVTGGVLVATGVVVFALVVVHGRGRYRDFETWQAAHEARREEPVVSVESVEGQVLIDPGRRLEGQIEVRFRGPEGTGLDTLVWTLNPGLEVASITDGSGSELAFEHGNGLLEVRLREPLEPLATTTLKLDYGGRIVTDFGYLDSFKNPLALAMFETQIAILGVDPGIFEGRYVVLTPTLAWLPLPGPGVGADDALRRPRDLFALDLTVDVPADWLAAGPGLRQEVPGAGPGRVRYRFAPVAPLPEVALVASVFSRRFTEVEGVVLEVLVHPDHTANLDFFADAAEEIKSWIGTRLRQAREMGLPYPYRALSLVEVPAMLRGFGGGWRMDTVQAPPGLLFMRENSFPNARFHFPFRDPEKFQDREGGLARAKREALERFFENDFNGGNVFHGAARNLFLYQTVARGEGGVPLEFVNHDLVNRLVTGKEGFFSAHLFNAQIGAVVGSLFQSRARQQRQISLARSVMAATSERPEVWNQALEVALGEMDPWQDPGRMMNVLQLKGGALSRWILDGLGRARTGELLATLRARHRGGTYTADDLLAAGQEVGVDLEELVGDWLGATALPGFVASQAQLFRLTDAEDASPRYQLLLHLRNDEAAPGLVRLEYSTDEVGRSRRWEKSEPIRVPPRQSVEIGLVTSQPPRAVSVEPYISLNRRGFPVAIPAVDEDAGREGRDAPLLGARPSDWRPPGSNWIVVDDLDPGFRIEGASGPSGLRLGSLGVQLSYDQGLPLFTAGSPPREWSRWVEPNCWGKYRRTLAMVRAGTGDKMAVFSAELPAAGSWRLALHLPPKGRRLRNRRWALGEFELTLVEGSERRPLRLDSRVAEAGWNELGEFELPAGVVEVELSDKTTGQVVLADAIRWQSLSAKAAATPDSGTADSRQVATLEPGLR